MRGMVGRLRKSIAVLNIQLRKIEGVYARMEEHEKELFDRCVKYTSEGDHARAVLYANECAELRKILLNILKAKLALERVILELHTIETPEDATALPKLINVLTALRKQLGGIAPDVSHKINRTADELSRLVARLNIIPPLESTNREAEKILEEAERTAEERLKDKPEIPKHNIEELR
ncbi:MAG: hypothetical protein QXT26_07920 [Thermoproteota archaeon]